MLRIYKKSDYESMSRQVANLIAAQVTLKPKSVLGLATGSTPNGAYKYLIESCKQGDLSFAEISTVNLDEYVGLAPDHEQSYRYYMNDNLFNHVDIKLENTHVPNGLATHPTQECLQYEQLIADLGGVDLQLLGMGHNGHIAFNEPSESYTKITNVVDLAERTIQANSIYFENDVNKVPKQAFTMGIGSIMRARKIVIAVSGAEKAESLVKAFQGPITPSLPASILQVHHDVVLVADEAALSKF
ncbi:MAG: glucosamine-6-phosphate deaminase [Eubacteriales bacterium]